MTTIDTTRTGSGEEGSAEQVTGVTITGTPRDKAAHGAQGAKTHLGTVATSGCQFDVERILFSQTRSSTSSRPMNRFRQRFRGP